MSEKKSNKKEDKLQQELDKLISRKEKENLALKRLLEIRKEKQK